MDGLGIEPRTSGSQLHYDCPTCPNHSERQKLYAILVFLSAIGLKLEIISSPIYLLPDLHVCP